MRLASFQHESGVRIAAAKDDGYVDLHETDSGFPRSMRSLISAYSDWRSHIEAAVSSGTVIPASDMQFLAPVPDAQKIICIGLNYADHAAESGVEPPSEPVVFNKFPTAIAASGDAIELPQCSEQVDYEAELVVVIGKSGRNITREDAMHHVFGYCCGHDVSARDWQLGRPGGQWLLGKTFDTFAPMGPDVVTADEIEEPGNLRVQLRLNGETLQDSTTAQLIFPIDQLISHLSSICTLCPGDVIFTGTPPGVGMARKPPIFLQDGDTVEVEIEHLGVLSNSVVSR